MTEENIGLYENLIQWYEAEFSKLTRKKPNPQGVFELDTQLGEKVTGLLLMADDIPAGVAAIAVKADNSYEMCEYYVVPSFRKHSLGTKFAHLIWTMYPGEWEIKQIEGAEYACEFWRKTITAFHHTPFHEDRCIDSYWGVVTRQRFTIDKYNPAL